jgi:type I restriction-modification system DNA methylase subunit
MPQDKTKDIAYVNDFQTPQNVCEYMVSLIPAGVKTVLEPTPGLGNLVTALKDYEVTAPIDYWLLDKTQRFDAIIGNLPFSSKTFTNCPPEYEGKGMIVAYKQMNVLMEMSDNIILLMPWFTISDSDVRLRTLKRYGLISVTALPRKTFQYARIQTCVLQLQKGYSGASEFKVFDLL